MKLTDLVIPVRMLIVGYPGSGKTGALCSLLNAGFKVRMLMYDKVSNLQPLRTYTQPDKLANLDVILLEDKMRVGQQFQEPVGIPTAFNEGLKSMLDWPGCGASKDWGPDTVVVLDSLTSMGEASMRRSMKFQNKTPLNMTDRVWGFAMAEQLAFVQALCSSANRHHTIVLSHLKMIGPKDVRNDDTDLTKAIKEQSAALIPTRLYPSALGRGLPQEIGKEFATILLAENKYSAGQVRKVLRSVPREELDLKLPASRDCVPAEVDLADGLLQIFRALSPESVELVTRGLPFPQPKEQS